MSTFLENIFVVSLEQARLRKPNFGYRTQICELIPTHTLTYVHTCPFAIHENARQVLSVGLSVSDLIYLW